MSFRDARRLALLTIPVSTSGTPTSTTTSLSALSTTAIKDGHRGAFHHRGHQHSPSANSLEAERADRISRLTGLSGVSTLRSPPPGLAQYNDNAFQTTPTSTGFSANAISAATAAGLSPAYFNAAGQPVAATKVSTVGSASATESVGGRTNTTTEVGDDNSTLGEDRDEDMLTEMDSVSASGYMGGDNDAMDEDLDNLTSRSVGAYEDHMSDDGSASLVGFGEGAGSTLSGPIYHRRPLPWQNSGASATGQASNWGLERSSSGLSEMAIASPNPHHGGSGRRDFVARPPTECDAGSDTPVSQSAVRERREARMMDGVALDNPEPPASTTSTGSAGDVFVDTTARGPVPVQPAAAATTGTSVTTNPTHERRRRQGPYHRQHATSQSQLHHSDTSTSTSTREAAERIVRERLDEGEGTVGSAALGSPGAGEGLGKFYFEER